jgi:3'-phosphoadenosine 5'-phosphosulfate sulfotransferase (PAPS reductase)/FAD synthetase
MVTLQEVLQENAKKSVRNVVPVSGGKDSAALAIYLKMNYPELDPEYVFSDTDCELPETYEFLEKLEALLGKPIVRINALDYMNIERKPNRKAFDMFLNELYGGFLPSPRSRWCTGVLKIKPFEQYVGNNMVYSYIGIRSDEDREGYIPKKPPKFSERPNIIPVYPFKDDGVTLSDVKGVLSDSGLGLPDYYQWRSRSGCFFCFYQQIGEWQGLIEHHPDLFEKAKSYEKTTGSKKFTWIEGKTLDDIAALEQKYKVADMDEVEGCAICHL